MNDARVLIVDDEPDFLRLVSEIFLRENIGFFTADNGEKAVAMAGASHPDLVLLDWNMPGMDGLAVCRALKAEPKTRDIPIILLTARSRETDTVLGLEMGAVDYISKRALRPRELVARVRAALRTRQETREPGGVLTDGKLTVNVHRHEASLEGTPLTLRPREFELLAVFLKNKGRVLSRHQLMETVWGSEFFGNTRAVDVAVARLRAQLGAEGRRLTAIKGLGYKFSED